MIILTDAEEVSDKTEHLPGKRRHVKGPQGLKTTPFPRPQGLHDLALASFSRLTGTTLLMPA